MKTRREFLRMLAGCALPAYLSAHRLGGDLAYGQTQRPNVLLISLDDMNDWIGCLHGHPQVKTPNIDRLARRGVLFTNAHVNAPVCNPSRTSFLTGIRPSTSGVYDNDMPFRLAMPNAVTLPQHFMNHGYRTSGAGKTSHGGADPQSWHDYFPSLSDHRPPEEIPPTSPLNGLPGIPIDWGPLDQADEEIGDAVVARWTAEQLRKAYEAPFFLAAGLIRTHAPWYAPTRYFDLYPPDSLTLPPVNLWDLEDLPPAGVAMAKKPGAHYSYLVAMQHQKLPEAVSAYLASISFADALVGRILDALDRGPHAGNTIVVLWGDNGWHMGEKLRFGKNTLWERATRCPLIIVAPGLTAPGGRCDRPVSMLDVYPTLIDLCGLTPRPELEGVSLRPLLVDPEAAWDRPAITTCDYQNHAVRSQRWRYIRYADGSEELYDHETDALEEINLAGNPAYQSVKEELALWLPTVNAPP